MESNYMGMNNIFDAMPMIMNLPVEIPSEVPIIQAQSKDNKYKLNISRKRFDFIIACDYNEEQPYEVYKRYKKLISQYYKEVNKAVKINRVGVIFSLFKEEKENLKSIYDKYMKQDMPSGSTEISIRTNKQNVYNEIVYNNISLIEPAMIKSGSEIYNGVWYQLDTNNVVNDKIFTTENIAEIITQASNKLKNKELKEMV